MTSFDPVGIPLIVGVTGHRDLFAEDLPAIRDAVVAKLKWLESIFQSRYEPEGMFS